MRLLIKWLILTAVILAVARFLPGIAVDDVWAAVLAAAALGLINTFLRPILSFFAFPLTLLTLGLFTFVLNAILVLVAEAVVPGFRVDGFLWALVFGAILSPVHYLLKRF